MDVADGGHTGVLFGREDELARLHELLPAAAGGSRQVVVVSGELGIGKSSLAAELLRTWDGHQLLGHCLPVEGEAMPFAPITSSLRGLLRSLPEETATELAQQWPRAFVDFLPFEFLDAAELGPREPDEAQVSSSGQARLFEWLLTLVCKLSADRPLIWVIEDVHWSDRSTLDLVGFLARNLRSENVVLLLTLRTDELDREHPIRRWLVELDRLSDVTRIGLKRLTREATQAQLVHLMATSGELPRQSMTELVYERSDGNPLFTEQLVSWAHDVASQWPDTLHDLVGSRLSLLPARTRSVLDAAAVLGRTFSLAPLAEVLGRDEMAVEADLGPAIERQLVRPDAAADYSFAKPLIREVLEADLLPGERRRLHEAAAQAKSRLLSGAVDTQFELVGEIAHHWHTAGVDEKAFAATVEAGLSAERLYALAEADQYFGRAVAMPCAAEAGSYSELSVDRLDVLLHASQAAHLTGDGARAVAWIDSAAELTDDPQRLSAVLERKGAYCFNAGRFDEAKDAYHRALDILPEEPSVSRARVLSGLCLLEMAWSRMDEAEQACHEALRIARVVGAREAEGRALNALGVLTMYRGEFDEGIGFSREAVAIAEELENADDLATGYIDLAHVLGVVGRFDEAVEVCRVGYAAMRRVGLARQDGSFLQANAAESLIKAGRWPEAAELLEQASASQARGVRAFPVLEHEARLRLRMGDFGRAYECVDQARVLFAEFDAPDGWHREFHEVAAELLVWRRRPTEALAQATAGLALLEGQDEERFAGTLLLTATQAVADLLDAARTQRDEQAEAELLGRVEELKSRARSIEPSQLPEAEAIAMTTHAEFLRCEAAGATADEWAVVAGRWESLGQPFPAAYAYWREAEARVMSKQVGHRPVSAVRRAHAMATELGAAALVAEVENLARWGRIQLGPAAAVEDAGGSDAKSDLGLTRREQEVLSGLLAGQTNREIADSLFISVKTSSVHVSNILRKLGVKTREEAARVAHRQISGG